MLSILIALVVIGFAAYLILTYVPLAPPVRTVVIAVGVIIMALWLLQVTGVAHVNLGRLS